MIAVGIFLVSAVDQALMQNYVSFLRFDKGMDLRTTISWSGMLLGIIAIASKIGSGWIFDRFSIRGIAFFWGMLSLSIFLGLPVAGFGTLLLFIVIRGIAHGGLIVDVPVLTKHFYGMERIGTTMGLLSLCVNLGYAAGPPIFGWFADTYGNFTIGMIVFGVVAAIGTCLLLPIRPRYWTPPHRPRDAVDEVTRPVTAAG
jgi:MFS family permease